MTRHCDNLLCQGILSSIDDDKLKSEAYIDAFLKEKIPIYSAHSLTTGVTSLVRLN